MDLLLKEMSIDGKAVYEFNEVMHTMDFGAIEKLLMKNNDKSSQKDWFLKKN